MKMILLAITLAEIFLPTTRPSLSPAVAAPVISPAVPPPAQPIPAEPKIETRMEPAPVSCFVVRPYVWIYGVEASMAWAKGHGYSDRQIFALKKRCWD